MRRRLATPDPQRVDMLGSPVDALSAGDALARIDGWLDDPWDGTCRHVVTLNPEYVMAARRDRAFAEAIRRADLRTADGVGVEVAARLLGGARASAVGRVTGVDLVEHLCAATETRPARLFFLGAAPGVADRAAQRLRARMAWAQIVGSWAGGRPRLDDDAEALRRIRDSGADAVAVAYGAPGQVLWIERNREALAAAGVRLAVGVGGAFDYLSGLAPRAPRWIRRVGLEWLFRLVREPSRWRRQLALPRFAALVLVAWATARRRA